MPNAETTAPGAVPERQMSDEELAAEGERSRAVGLISVGTVIAFAAGFFCLWLVQKDAAKAGGDVSALLLIAGHKTQFILSYFFFAIGTILVAPPLVHLSLAVKARRPATPKFMLIVAFAGPLLVALALPAFTLAQVSVATDFAEGTVKTAAEASRLLESTAIEVTTIFYRFAQLLIAIAWAMVSLYAMRAGLLTKLVGIVGVAIGAASVFAPPLAAILQVFWIGSLSIMLLGRPQGRPPAWVMGRAVPWSEVRELGAQEQGENPEDFVKADAADAPADKPDEPAS